MPANKKIRNAEKTNVIKGILNYEKFLLDGFTLALVNMNTK